MVGGCVCAPKEATCNGKIYDFFVVSKCLVHAVHSAVTIADAGLTPHSPARLFLRATPRHEKARCLKAPKGFKAHLPFGPEVETKEEEEKEAEMIAAQGPVANIDLECEFATLVSGMGRRLAAVAGLN